MRHDDDEEGAHEGRGSDQLEGCGGPECSTSSVWAAQGAAAVRRCCLTSSIAIALLGCRTEGVREGFVVVALPRPRF